MVPLSRQFGTISRRLLTVAGGSAVAIAAALLLIGCAASDGILSANAPASAPARPPATGHALSGPALKRVFGALAFAPSLQASGRAAVFFGAAATEDAAIHKATTSCARHARDCRPLGWVKNGYAAVVYRPVERGPYGYGWGTSREQAASKAAQACASRSGGSGCLGQGVPGHFAAGRTVSGATSAAGRNAIGGPPSAHQIKVPFATQNGTGASNCGPAAITMVIRYYRGSTTVEKTASAMRGKLSTSKKGIFTLHPGPSSRKGEKGYTDVETSITQWWLNRHVAGLSEHLLSTFGQIKDQIDDQRPVIALVWMHGGNHYVVVTGYDSKYVYINDPYWYGPSQMPISSFTAAEDRIKGAHQEVSFGYFTRAGPVPLLSMSVATMWVSFCVLWVYLLLLVIFDVLRSGNLGRWGKACWLTCTIATPFVGVFVYMIANRGTAVRLIPDNSRLPGRRAVAPPGRRVRQREIGDSAVRRRAAPGRAGPGARRAELVRALLAPAGAGRPCPGRDAARRDRPCHCPVLPAAGRTSAGGGACGRLPAPSGGAGLSSLWS